MYRTLNISDNGYSDSLDPNTGEMAALPRMGTPWDPATNITWPAGIVIVRDAMLAGTSTAVAPSSLRNQFFDGNMGLEDALQMKTATVKKGATMTVTNSAEFPKTFAFKTESGRIGLLQILWFTDNSRTVKLRYKLLQDGGTEAGTAPPGAAVAQPDLRRTEDEVARLKLQFAEKQFKTADELYKIGRIARLAYEQAKAARDIAAADLSGDLVEVARIKLQIAELEFSTVEKQHDAGEVDSVQYDKAKLARDVAAVQFRQAQTAKSK